MIRLLLACALALLPLPALAQPRPADSSLWQRSGERITFTTARFSFPVEAGPVRLLQAAEFSDHGGGRDSGLQYISEDQEVFATVYVYYPGLPHAGLTAFATDTAIRLQSDSGLRRLSSGLVGAGGRDGMAIRSDYSGFRNNRMASSAAFIKAGRWIVKFRVSGPERRRREVEATMTALLDGMRFEGETLPRAPEPIEVGNCPPAAAAEARLLPRDSAEAMEDAIIGILDGSGPTGREEGAEQRAGTPLLGRQWCLSSPDQVGRQVLGILRAQPAAGAAAGGKRSLMIVVVSDSGTIVELVETHFRNRARYVLLHHEIGRTRVLGAYDAIPTDGQILAILSGNDRAGGQPRATILHRADGNSEVEVHVMPEHEDAVPVT